MSLRERNKTKRRQVILDAARAQFLEHGYSSANMDGIAKVAGVGVATVYNHFSTKEGIVSELVRSDFREIAAEIGSSLADLPPSPVDAVDKVLTCYRQFDSYLSYDLMREFISQAKTKGPVREAFDWCHKTQVDQIESVLIRARDKGRINPALNIGMAASIIVDLHERYIDRLTIIGPNLDEAVRFKESLGALFLGWTSCEPE